MGSLKEFLFQPIKWETHNPSVLLEGVVAALDRAMAKTGKGLQKIYENNVLDGVLELYPLQIEVYGEAVPIEERVERKGRKLIYRVHDQKFFDKYGKTKFKTKPHILRKDSSKKTIGQLPQAVQALNQQKSESRALLEAILNEASQEEDYSEDGETQARVLFDILKRQFDDPYKCIVEMGQNSDGATTHLQKNEMNISVGKRDIPQNNPIPAGIYTYLTFSDKGCGMTQEVIDSVFLSFFASLNEKNPDAEGEFGVGAISVFTLDPEYVIVDSLSADAKPAGVIIDKNIVKYDRASSRDSIGTDVTLLLPENRSLDAGRIKLIADNYLKYLRTPIFISVDGSNPEELTRPFRPSDDLQPENTIAFREAGVEGFLEFRPGEGKGIGVHSRRIRLFDFPDNDFTGAISYNGLPKAISRNSLTDSNIESLLQQIVEGKKHELLTKRNEKLKEEGLLRDSSLVSRVLDRKSYCENYDPTQLNSVDIDQAFGERVNEIGKPFIYTAITTVGGLLLATEFKSPEPFWIALLPYPLFFLNKFQKKSLAKFYMHFGEGKGVSDLLYEQAVKIKDYSVKTARFTIDTAVYCWSKIRKYSSKIAKTKVPVRRILKTAKVLSFIGLSIAAGYLMWNNTLERSINPIAGGITSSIEDELRSDPEARHLGDSEIVNDNHGGLTFGKRYNHWPGPTEYSREGKINCYSEKPETIENPLDDWTYATQAIYSEFTGWSWRKGPDLIPGSRRFRKVYTSLPEIDIDPRLTREVFKLMDRKHTIEDKVEAAKWWMSDNFEYSMKNEGEDIEEWLRNKHVKCDSKATVMAYILRSKKIPTRYVVGMMGDSCGWAPHAWVEYYHNKKWARVDIMLPIEKAEKLTYVRIKGKQVMPKDADSDNIRHDTQDNSISRIGENEEITTPAQDYKPEIKNEPGEEKRAGEPEVIGIQPNASEVTTIETALNQEPAGQHAAADSTAQNTSSAATAETIINKKSASEEEKANNKQQAVNPLQTASDATTLEAFLSKTPEALYFGSDNVPQINNGRASGKDTYGKNIIFYELAAVFGGLAGLVGWKRFRKKKDMPIPTIPISVVLEQMGNEKVQDYLMSKATLDDSPSIKSIVTPHILTEEGVLPFSLSDLKNHSLQYVVSYHPSHMDDMHAGKGRHVIDGRNAGIRQLINYLEICGVKIADSLSEYVVIPLQEKPEDALSQEQPEKKLTLVEISERIISKTGLDMYIHGCELGTFIGDASTSPKYALIAGKETRLLLNPAIEKSADMYKELALVFNNIIADLPVKGKAQFYSKAADIILGGEDGIR